MITVVFATLFSNKKNDLKTHKNIYIIYLFILILFFEWFYNHPTLRYGGYSLIALIIFIPFSIVLSKIISKKYLRQKIIFLITLSLVIFVGRNLDRIDNEINQYKFQPVSYPFYKINENHFRIDLIMNELIQDFEDCKNKNYKNCNKNKEIYTGKKRYYYYFKKKYD